MKLNLRREAWNIGVLPCSAAEIVRNGITRPVQWLPPPNRWEFMADPSCLSLGDGRAIILAEHLSYWNERGEIWAAVVKQNNWTEMVFRPWLRANFHLSYPFPFRDDSTLYLVCESWEVGGSFLWKHTQDGWQMCGPILQAPAIDVTIWRGSDRWWLFCTMANDCPNERLYIYYAATPSGPWRPHRANPVKTDIASSRPAGPLFMCDGRLIRPAQDCSLTYGGGIILNVVEQIDEHSFQEHALRQLTPDRIYPHGLHTICPAGDVTIVDGKRWDLHPLDLARKTFVPITKRMRQYRLPQWPNDVADLV